MLPTGGQKRGTEERDAAENGATDDVAAGGTEEATEDERAAKRQNQKKPQNLGRFVHESFCFCTCVTVCLQDGKLLPALHGNCLHMERARHHKAKRQKLFRLL